MSADPLLNTLMLHRYRIDERIGSGGMGIVYRAFDRLRQQNVALKRVLFSPQAWNPSLPRSSDPAGSLAREFQILASLRHPNIISVLDYGFDEEGIPYLTMDLLSGATDIVQESKPEKWEMSVHLLTQMLLALTYLHRRGILHRDLKPSNVLVDAKKTVRLLDFGLARRSTQPDNQTGTLSYMAPEVLQRKKVDSTADLFSLGVIAYEMFTGKHPFAASNASQLIQKVLHAAPDITLLSHLPDALQAVVLRLLAKAPQERFASSADVLQALYAAINRPLPPETTAYRNEVLYTPAFAGRSNELFELKEASQTLTDEGQTWLVSGVSGSGKSRLLNELRIYAVARGMRVLYGSGEEASPVTDSIWRSVLPELVLEVPLEDAEASILKPLVPQLEQLIERPVADAPEVDYRKAREHLAQTILSAFRRLQRPLLLFMDDLQWVSDDELYPLQLLHKAAPELPLLIICAYRSDEAPYLYGKFPLAKQIELSTLARPEIMEIVRAMMGERSDLPEIVDFLVTHTEGNALFLVEVLRIMADSAGGIEQIQTTEMPVELASQGVTRVLKQRLQQIRLDDQPMLRLAALLGQEIDFDLLQVHDPEMEYEDWLMRAADAAILTVESGVWRFTHDKVREAILYGLDGEYVRNLHEKAAISLEAVYGVDAAYTEAIVDQWLKAERIDRAMTHLPIALSKMSARGEFDAVAALAKKALDYAPDDSSYSFELIGKIQMHLGHVYYKQGKFEQAMQQYNDILTAAQQHEIASLESEALGSLGNIASSRGNFEEAADYMDRAIQIMRTTDRGRKLSNLLSNRAAVAARIGDLDTAEILMQENLKLSQELREPYAIASGLINLGNLALIRAEMMSARDLYQRALEISEGNRFENLIAATQNNLGTIHGVLGDYKMAEENFQRGLLMGRKLGDHARQVMALYSLGSCAVHQRQFKHAREYLADAYELAQSAQSKYEGLQITSAAVHASAGSGRLEEARKFFVDSLHFAIQIGHPTTYLPTIYGAIGWAMATKAFDLAAEWVAYFLSEMPSSDLRQRHIALFIQPELEKRLGAAAYREAILRSKYLQLPQLIQQLHAQLSLQT